MASSAVEKTAEELHKEIQELHRQQQEITERLRDPRGIRRGGTFPTVGTGGPRNRGVVRPAVDAEEPPPPKRRVSSAIVKLEDGEIKAGVGVAQDAEDPLVGPCVAASRERNEQKTSRPGSVIGGFKREGNSRMRRVFINMMLPEPTPREPKLIQDASLVKRNKRMLGQLLGTLEKFHEEDEKLSSTDAYMHRSDLLRRAEEKAQEESEKLRLQERERIAEKQKRDLILRARVAAKAQEKKWELLFLSWSEHHKKLSNFLRTKAGPPIYYMPAKPLVDDPLLVEQHREQVFLEWKTT